MKNYCLGLFLLLTVPQTALSQDKSLDIFIVANTNLCLPGNSSDKEVYPILGYNKDADPKLLVGGFGLGALVFKNISQKFKAKGQLNFSKLAYWDKSQILTDNAATPVGYYSYATSDYKIGVNASAHYALTGRWMLGTGLGVHALLFSKFRTPDNLYLNGKEVYANNHVRKLMPIMPLEVSYKLSKALFSLRYEQGLLNQMRGDLSDYKDERFGVLYFEVGFKL